MQYNKNYNRNLMGGKRCNRGIQKYGKYKNLVERFKAEVNALNAYHKRVGQFQK